MKIVKTEWFCLNVKKVWHVSWKCLNVHILLPDYTHLRYDGAEHAYSSGAPSVTPVLFIHFVEVHIASNLIEALFSLICIFYRLSFLFGSLLSSLFHAFTFTEFLRIWITPPLTLRYFVNDLWYLNDITYMTFCMRILSIFWCVSIKQGTGHRFLKNISQKQLLFCVIITNKKHAKINQFVINVELV